MSFKKSDFICCFCEKSVVDEWAFVYVDGPEVGLCCRKCLSDDGDPIMREYGQRGGKKGGLARAAVLSPERRSEIAKIAANKRWKK